MSRAAGRRFGTVALCGAVLGGTLLGCDSGSSTPRPGAHATSSPTVSSPAVPSSAAPSREPAARVTVDHAATLPGGLSRTVAVRRGHDVLLLGGLTTGDVTTARIWQLDVRTGRTTTAGSLAEAVHDASGALLGNAAVVFGGGAATEVADVQAWTSGTAHVVGRLPAGRSDSGAAVVGGTAYVVGGFDGSSLDRSIVATRDGRRFRVVGRLRQGSRYPAVAAFDGAVWVVGGQLATTAGTTGGPQTAAIQRFDPATGRTTVVGRMPHRVGHAMAFVLGGRLFVAGGIQGATATDRVWSIDPETGKARPAGGLPQPLSDAAVVAVDGDAWLVGGERTGPLAPLRSVLRVRSAG